MSRKVTKKEIKQLKQQYKANKRKNNIRLLKMAFVLAVIAIIAGFLIGPNPLVIISRIVSFVGSAKDFFVAT